MINKYVSDIAAQMGITLTKISLVNGKFLGCRDAHSLMMSAKSCSFSAIVYQADLAQLVSGGRCERLESDVRSSLSRLQLMLEN